MGRKALPGINAVRVTVVIVAVVIKKSKYNPEYYFINEYVLLSDI